MTVLIALIITLLASATGLMIVFRNLSDDDVYDMPMLSVHSDMESAPSQEKQSPCQWAQLGEHPIVGDTMRPVSPRVAD
jgi:hypothetical protein